MDLKRINKTDEVVNFPDDYNDNLTEIEQELDNKVSNNRVKTDVPSGAVFTDTVYDDTEIKERVETLEQREKMTRYGVRRKLGATTAELERLGDSVGLVANADDSLVSYNVVRNDFDNIFPWSHMRKCVIEESGKIIYQGYPNYETSNGDYMIEIPSFYLKHTVDDDDLEYWVSAYSGQGFVKTEKFYIAQFKTSEGDKSRPNTTPLVFQALDTFRNGARSKGDGWQVIDMYGHYILRVLYQVEFAHLNSQTILGTGVTSGRYSDDSILVAESNTNTVTVSSAVGSYFEIGETVSISTTRGSSSAIAHDRLITDKQTVGENTEITLDVSAFNVGTNHIIYHVGQHTGKTLDLTSSSGQSVGRSGRQSITYRGVEDIFGNVYEWIDGTLINDRQAYTCNDPSKYSNSLTSDYKEIGYTNHETDGYVSQMGFDENYPHVEFPVKTGAGSSTGYCDNYYQNTGLRAPRVGGFWTSGATSGFFLWSLTHAPSNVNVNNGARLNLKK